MPHDTPWSAIKESEHVSAHVLDAKGRQVCDVYGDSWDERSARAQLFAATPDLLAALKYALPCIAVPKAYTMAEAAIRKAEGR